ncbi:MAG: cation transporter [Bacteroidales bacterium]|jgi:NADH:ubiquinone oxidoreductase subunit 6 (subunit J)|nr:cation transporter [Bacteroidales bacterium]
MKNKNLLNIALILSLITIGYNIIEGIVSVYFGLDDEALSLLGFGTDSFVEVISGTGIAHMVLRMRHAKVQQRDRFEKTALRITGTSFFLLTAGIVTGSVVNILQNNKPVTTVPGIIIAGLSIVTMYFLMHYKLKIGKKLNSEAILADAQCTKSCFYLSIVLLVSSGLYMIFKIGFIDILGSLAIAWFAFKEGREAFEKANSNQLSCCCDKEQCG